MIVKRNEFQQLVKKLSNRGEYGLDTETTGLDHTDTLFSIILADESDAYYFNFNSEADHLGNYSPYEETLPRSWIEELAPIVENEESFFFMQNAKFDLGMLTKEGLQVCGTIHDTEVMDRVLFNAHLGHKPYSLGAIALRRGFKKDDRVDDYLKEHGLITKAIVRGKEIERKHFDKVPFTLMSEYGQTDARITLAIGKDQIREAKEQDGVLIRPTQPLITDLMGWERKLTKVCFEIEQTGIKIDREFTKKALEHTRQELHKEHLIFKQLTGLDFVDSASVFVPAFAAAGIELPKTKTGRPSANKQVLDALENPIADQIRLIRGKQSLISTYYENFLYYADENDLIHANMRQGGTETLRFSYSNPNLQNLPKEDEEEDRLKQFLVRRCFVSADASEWVLVAIDYKQQEYRLMADYANERGLIDAIMGGEDVHEATARMLGITRKQAKTLNFGLLYGMGVAKLARALGVSIQEAQELKNLYFSRLAAVKEMTKDVMANGKSRGYIFNFSGFRSHLTDPEYAYVLPNHLIQGSGAAVVRRAMVLLDAYIREHQLKSRILLQVHDELLFQVHRTEYQHIAAFKKIMEDVYIPRHGCFLECDVTHSYKSFAKWDQVKGIPA